MKSPIAKLPPGVGCWADSEGGWRVRLGKKFTGGPVQRRRFDTLKDAREWIFGDAKKEQAAPPPITIQKAEAGNSSFQLTPRQISEAAAAVKALGELGTLTEAVAFYIKHSRPAGGERSVADAAEAYLAMKRASGRSEKHLKGLKSNFKTFTDDFGKHLIHVVRRDAIEEWLEELEVSPTTKGNYIRDLKSLFEEATRREWLAVNPIAHLEKPQPASGEIHILQPDELTRLLASALEHEPLLVPAIALKAFAGLRTSELLQLTWKEIGKKEIFIAAAKAKTRKRRLITIQPNLDKWLSFYRGTGPIFTGTQNQYHCRLEHIAATAEISLPSNVLRHSFGTYLFAKTRNENLVAAEMGNSPKVVFSNYRALIEKATAAKYWRILPPSRGAKIIRLTPKAA